MAAIFPPGNRGGIPPGPNAPNSYVPVNAVTGGEGPLYVSNDCSTFDTAEQVNAVISEILAAVDRLGISYNSTLLTNLGDALVTRLAENVKRVGDTMEGFLTLTGQAPTADYHAAPKVYVDDAIATRLTDAPSDGTSYGRNNGGWYQVLPLIGGTLTGPLTLAGNPTDQLQAATKAYADQLMSTRVARGGDSMLGMLTLFADPSTPGHAATKAYVDTGDATKVSKGGDTMTGPLTLPADPTLPLEAATKAYVDSHAGTGGGGGFPDSPYDANAYGRYQQTWLKVLPLGGGTLTGTLTLAGAPSNALDAATKAYVDAQIAPLLAGTLMTTGDAKLTLKNAADAGWVLMNDGSIGSATSGATTRANADCHNLFTLLWNNIPDAYAPVAPTPRGASAQADWDANKRITLTRQLGRTLAIAGAGAGLTSRALGQFIGEETHTPTLAESVQHTHAVSDPNHTHPISDPAHLHGFPNGWSLLTFNPTGTLTVQPGADYTVPLFHTYVGATGASQTGISALSASSNLTIQYAGSSTPFNVMQPTSFWNIMLKL